MTLYTLLLWVGIVGGLVPGVYFVATYRLSLRLGWRGLDAGGWVAAIVLLYVGGAARAATGQEPPPALAAQALNLVIAFSIDGLLWVRAWHWRNIRREAREASDSGVLPKST